MDYNDEDYRVVVNKDEEIKRFMLDEDLSETKRAQTIIMKGVPKQKIALYTNIARLLNLDFENLYQYVKADLMEQTEEILIVAGKSLIQINRSWKEVLQLTLHLLMQYNQKVAEAWVPVLGVCLKKVQQSECSLIERQIISLTEARQLDVGRWIGALMMGQTIEVFKDNFKGVLLDRFRQMCQDSDSEVREVIVSQIIPQLLKNLSQNLIDQYVTDKIFEMLYDSNLKVKRLMIETFCLHQHKISRGDWNFRILGTFLDFLQTSQVEALEKAAELSGRAYISMLDIADEDFVRKFVELFTKLGNSNNENIRKWYVYNLPGILTTLKQPYLHQIVEIENRELAFAIFHELVKYFEPSKVFSKYGQLFQCLLNLEDLDLITKLNLGQIYKYIKGSEPHDEQIQKFYNESNLQIAKIFDKCIMQYKLNQPILEQILSLVEYIDVEDFEKLYLPNLFKDQYNRDCDILSMKILTKYFITSKNYLIQQRIKDFMNNIFYTGNNQKRIKYIYWVAYIPQYVSKRRFTDLNCNQVLNYANDRQCVQIQLIKHLPMFYHYLSPQEYGILKMLQGKTIQEIVQNVFDQLNEFEVDDSKMMLDEDILFSQFQVKMPKQETNFDYLKKSKRIVMKQSQAKKTPSSHSVRQEKSMEVTQKRRFTEFVSKKKPMNSFKS
ncbi:hypothetical protein pb186bvf_006655 [Paramecium bursaria]